jgi:phosphomethylpyrimidine synthase
MVKMTLMKEAKLGKVNEEMVSVAKKEEVDVEYLRRMISCGKVVVLKNIARDCEPIGIGKGLRTKINANIGTSSEFCNLNYELEKAKVAVKYGVDTIMDLSTSGDLDLIRRKILKEVKVPIGTVPIYQAAVDAIRKHAAIVNMSEDEIFNVIERHAKDGVDFMTIHAGITKDIVEGLKRNSRVTGIVSRGGAFLASWIIHNEDENPLYKNFDYLLEIARRYDFCISLGDALRPGCLEDASDWFQIQELINVQKLVEKCWENDVQVIVEGPGHLPLDQVEANVRLQKSLCKDAPFYVLGPLVTDIGAGYDHIVGAIGGAIAALAGADFLCYVTPSEHLGLPTVKDVKEGVIAARIAAHAADIVKLGNKASKFDLEMAKARAELNWNKQYELSVDPENAREVRERIKPKSGACTMCGDYCVFKILQKKEVTKCDG